MLMQVIAAGNFFSSINPLVTWIVDDLFALLFAPAQ